MGNSKSTIQPSDLESETDAHQPQGGYRTHVSIPGFIFQGFNHFEDFEWSPNSCRCSQAKTTQRIYNIGAC